jgi:hypothetical protein
MKTMKRALAVLLAVALLCIGVPLAAAADVVDSGTCGDNLTWTLDSEGLLAISGTGAMSNYTEADSPFYANRLNIKSVSIESGVTSIGEFAFYGCSALQSVMMIPDGVTSIGDGAFRACSGLTSVTIPDSVTSIGEKAFSGCISLTSVTIGNSVTSVGGGAFAGCSRLTSLRIPNSVLSIGNSAFEGCTGLNSVILGENLLTIGGRAFYRCSKLNSVIIQNSVTIIDGGAFWGCSNLTSITIPNSVKSIGNHAFYSCSKLTRITLPDSIMSIGDDAFDYCDALKDVYYAGNEDDWSGISIGYNNYHLISYPSIHFLNYRHDHYYSAPIRENECVATCTTAASYEATTHCTICSEELSRETVYEGEPDPNNHASKTYTTASTCAENGFSVTYCTRCGETLSHEILPRLEHTWNDGEVTAEPTCTAQGVKTFTCGGCGATYTEPVDLLAHQWNDGEVTKEPSCTEAGEITYTCATGGETRTEPIDKLDHKIVLVPGVAPTCEEPGLTDGWQCKTCQKWFAEQQTIEALDHDPQIGKVVEPTCTEPGYTPFICTRCGETVSKTDPTDALGHNPQPVYTWAKDDSTVTAEMTCTRCGEVSLKETADVTTEVTVKPTCSTEGELTLTAAFNNKAFYAQTKTKVLPMDPDAHVFRVTVTPPTCLDDGYTTHACTLCRYGYSDEIVAALGHDYVNAKATGNGDGTHTLTCNRCKQPGEAIACADEGNDGKCDACGDQMQGGDHCKYCGKVHNGNFFDKLTGFFHKIFAVFKR